MGRSKDKDSKAVEEVAKVEETKKERRKREKKEQRRLEKKAAKKAAKKASKQEGKRQREEEPEESRPSKKRKLKSSSSSSSSKPKVAPADSLAKTNADRILMEQYRKKEAITVSGAVTDWMPVRTFAGCGYDADLLEITKTFKEPSPIQSQTWPILQADFDLIGIAETGSGKTLGFGMNALSIVKHSPKSQSPLVLIVAPTRELAIQTQETLERAGESLGITVHCFYGGVPKYLQREALRKGVNIAVATPGRLLDLCQEGCLSLANVKYFVLDEADRMLDMGFETDIRNISKQIPSGRQTAMFSATWPTTIQALAHEFLTDPIKVVIGTDDLSANKNVEQIIEVIEDRPRNDRLIQLLKEYHDGKNRVLVFALYKKEATRILNFITRRGFVAVSIHGDLSQAERMASLKSFTDGTTPILVATDVAARGLDIPKVEFVINFTFPLTIEDYVHRIGRTGRAGKKGISHTFFQPINKSFAGALVTVMKDAEQKPPKDHPIYQFPLFTKRKVDKIQEFKLGTIDKNAGSSNLVTFDDSDDE